MTLDASRQPASVAEIELSQPVPMLRAGTTAEGQPYSEALLVVRLHTLPIGAVMVLVPDGELSAEALLDAIVASLGEQISKHLAADGISHPVDANGVPANDDVPCLAHRRQLLANPPLASVVIPVVDRPELLRAVLRDLLAQSYPRCELVVVDNDPMASGAGQVVAELGDVGTPLRYVRQPVRGGSNARNRGLAAAAGEITAFVDADVRVDRHWLMELISPIAADPRVGGAAGLILPSELETRAQRWMEEWGGFGKGFDARILDVHQRADEGPLFPYAASLGSGTSMAFRTATLRRRGGFDTALGPATPARGGEDLSALLDVLMGGDRLAYAPGAIVWHPHPRTEEEFLAKLNAYGIGFTAHLTRVMVRRPRSIVDLGCRVPAAAGYLLRPSSPRNERRRTGFPARAVRRAEISGMLRGPFAYLAGVASQLRRRPRTWRTLSPS